MTLESPTCCEYHNKVFYVFNIGQESGAMLQKVVSDISKPVPGDSTWLNDTELRYRKAEADVRIASRNFANIVDKLVILQYLTPCNMQGDTYIHSNSVQTHWDNVAAEAILSGLDEE